VHVALNQHRTLTYLTVAYASFATLLFELTLTRILSYLFWNHLVYLAVSLALLGFGISGTLVSLASRKLSVLKPRFMSMLWLYAGLSLYFSLAFASWILPFLLQTASWVKLAVCYFLFTIPFVAFGAVLSIVFCETEQRVSRLYFIDLVAAGLGCTLLFHVLPMIGAQSIILVLAIGSFILGILWDLENRRVLRLCGYCSMILCCGVLFYHQMHPRFLDFVPERYKEMFQMMLTPKTVIEKTTWTPIGRIDVVGNDSCRLLTAYEDLHPVGTYKIITQDGSAHTRLLSKEAISVLRDESRSKKSHASALPYLLKTCPDVAVIGVGGGIDVVNALLNNSHSIYGIELNPATYHYVSEDYAEYGGWIFSDPRVTLVNDEGRHSLRGSNKQFDLIQIIAVDTFAALSTGAYALSENYLYTVEAMTEYFAKLKVDGVLSFFRWVFHPPRESLRLVTLAVEAWKRLGVEDFEDHIIVMTDGDWALSMFKKSPFTEKEVAAIWEKVEANGHYMLYWPALIGLPSTIATPDKYLGRIPTHVANTSKVFFELVDSYKQNCEQIFFHSYPYKIIPTTDNSPFFFETHKENILGLPELSSLRGPGVSFTLFLILCQSTFLILVAILLPLIKYNKDGLKIANAMEYSIYFVCLGMGFMLIEIAFVQKSVLFLGTPLYSLALVLTGLLISASLGSVLLSKLCISFKNLTQIIGFTFILEMLFVIHFLTPLFQNLLHLSFFYRSLVVLGILTPLGAAMGMFFPAGIEALKDSDSRFVPWAWGINGCCSVYGSIFAIVIGMAWGFNAAFWIGLGVYTVGFLMVQRISTPLHT